VSTTRARREPVGGRVDAAPSGGPGTTLGSDVSTLVTTLVLVVSIGVVLQLVRTDRDQPATRRRVRSRTRARTKRPSRAEVVAPVAASVAPPTPTRRPVVARRQRTEPPPGRMRSALTLLVLLSCLGAALAAGVALVVFLVSLALRQSGSRLPGG